MPDKYNPFRPDKMCPPGIFSGRIEELKTIDHCLIQTKAGNPAHFLLEGERGIGKSSLLFCEQLVAGGDLETLGSKKKLNFLVVSISLHEKDDYTSIIRKIAAELKCQVEQEQTLKTAVFKTIDFLTRIEAAGVRLRKDDKSADETELLGNLQTYVVDVITKLGTSKDGIVLLIDEADKPPAEAGLGSICKLLTEELTKRRTEKLCIGLAGLPNLIQVLRDNHESSPRLFKTMSLQVLEQGDREEVLERGLAEAKEKNNFETTMTPDAKRLICHLSEGYPHFLQEFAYCAFEEDADNVIDSNDVINSLFRENGAFDQLGRKYFNQYYAAVGSDAYRTVLAVMAEKMGDWIDRATIIKEGKLNGGIVDNALRALKAKNIIIHHDMKPGLYRLPTKSFAVWIKSRNQVEKAVEQSEETPDLFLPAPPPKAKPADSTD